MIRHQAIGQQSGRLTRLRFGEDALKGLVIAVLLEEGQAGVGPVQHVVDVAACGGAKGASHGHNLSNPGPLVKKKGPDTFSGFRHSRTLEKSRFRTVAYSVRSSRIVSFPYGTLFRSETVNALDQAIP